MKRAFSLIELIFVIVIIGILAAITMPKLNATRDDAKESIVIANTKKIINDVKNYYTSQGKDFWKQASVMNVTDVPIYINSCSTQATDTKIDNSEFYICNNNQKVVIIDINDTHISINPASSDIPIVKAIKNDKTFKSIAKAHRLGGINVTK